MSCNQPAPLVVKKSDWIILIAIEGSSNHLSNFFEGASPFETFSDDVGNKPHRRETYWLVRLGSLSDFCQTTICSKKKKINLYLIERTLQLHSHVELGQLC